MSHVNDAHNATHPPHNVVSTDPDGGSLQYSSSGLPIPPTAHIHPTKRSHHGHDVVDNYEWLRGKESPETLAYLRAENEYTDARTRDLAPLQDSIFHEIKSRTQETDLSVPVRSGKWWYYGRSLEGRAMGYRAVFQRPRRGTKQRIGLRRRLMPSPRPTMNRSFLIPMSWPRGRSSSHLVRRVSQSTETTWLIPRTRQATNGLTCVLRISEQVIS